MGKALGKIRTLDPGSWAQWGFERHKEEKAKSMGAPQDSESGVLVSV